VLKSGEETNLSQKADLALFRFRIDVEDLDRYEPLETEVSREKNRSIGPLTEFAFELVMARQRPF
jgi:hypothetical protein